MHEELNYAYRQSPREMYSEAVSAHVYIYLNLDVYGHGTCLRSLQLAMPTTTTTT